MPARPRRIPALTGFTKGAIAALALAGLAACDAALPVAAPGISMPRARPAEPVVAPVSPESAAMQVYYAKVQADLLAQGLLRTDGGGPDTPFTDRMLAENFIRIALFDEYQRGAGGLVQRETESRLRRWTVPVRVQVVFGDSVPPDRRATDRARIGSYLDRLAAITGHRIGLADSAPNFFVHIVNEDERRALGPVVDATLPGLNPSDIAGITQMPRSTYCLVYAMSNHSGSEYTRAFALIRAEHSDLMRLSCIHEEIAQGLGLANDSPAARPSIFNDDEEFALLTGQDELMLRMLYDRRLRPGMTVSEARPIIAAMAAGLVGGGS
ncbi:DUF2927 domain-containing protein [Paracoccaceae bacterium Fryx2]|nr:DUF2927 domain-containing protein [Paracoccaceae bacterium Fryx2]